MLLFTAASVDDDTESWAVTGSFLGERLKIEASLDHGRHMVVVRSAVGDERAAEVVSPVGLSPDDESVSSFHLPPYYRWESGEFSCRFAAEWREGDASVTVSLRHMQSLRSHPRALAVGPEDAPPNAAIIIGTPSEAVDPDTNEPVLRVDWRGWHVIDTNDPFDGPSRRILATHTQVFRGQVPSSTSSSN